MGVVGVHSRGVDRALAGVPQHSTLALPADNVVKMMGLSPRDGNQLIDTLNDMVKKGQMPKHLALENYLPDEGTDGARKHAKKITPGQIDEEEYDRQRDRAAELGVPRRKPKSVMTFSTHSKRSPEDEAKRKDNYKKAMAASLANIKKQFDTNGVRYEEKDPRLARAGVSGFNKPKRTPSHPTKSHIVVAKSGDEVKTIRFGQQGAETAGDPKKGESKRMKKKRKSFKARHSKNIAKGKMYPAHWADKVKW